MGLSKSTYIYLFAHICMYECTYKCNAQVVGDVVYPGALQVLWQNPRPASGSWPAVGYRGFRFYVRFE